MASDPGTVSNALGLRLEAQLRTIIGAIPQLMVADAGLVDYVESGELIAPSKEHKAVMGEEMDRQRNDEYNDRRGYSLKSPVTNALSEVFESVREG
jgi:hypothetical protein